MILKANKLLQSGQQDDAYSIIQQLLDKEEISFEYREPMANSQGVFPLGDGKAAANPAASYLLNDSQKSTEPSSMA